MARNDPYDEFEEDYPPYGRYADENEEASVSSVPAAPPSSASTGAFSSESDVANYLRTHGVAEGVIGDESRNLINRPLSDITGALPGYLRRSRNVTDQGPSRSVSPVSGPFNAQQTAQQFFPQELRDLIQQQLMFSQQQQQQAAEDRSRRLTQEEATRGALLDLIRQSSQPIDPNQALNTPESRSYARIAERAQARLRAQAAERTGQVGTGRTERGETGGALAGAIGGGERQAAENIAGFQSQLASRDLQQRRQQLMQALQLGAGLLSGDQQRDLQRQIAATDAALRQALGGGQLALGFGQLAQGGEQFNQDLAYRIAVQQAALNQSPYQYLF